MSLGEERGRKGPEPQERKGQGSLEEAESGEQCRTLPLHSRLGGGEAKSGLLCRRWGKGLELSDSAWGGGVVIKEALCMTTGARLWSPKAPV